MLNKNLIHIRDDRWVDPTTITVIEPVGEGIQVGASGCFIFFENMTVEEFMKLVSKEK